MTVILCFIFADNYCDGVVCVPSSNIEIHKISENECIQIECVILLVISFEYVISAFGISQFADSVCWFVGRR